MLDPASFQHVRLPFKLLQQQAQLLTNQINETGRGLDPNRNLIEAYSAARDCAGKLALFLEEIPDVPSV
jgi:hypothetical protein